MKTKSQQKVNKLMRKEQNGRRSNWAGGKESIDGWTTLKSKSEEQRLIVRELQQQKKLSKIEFVCVGVLLAVDGAVSPSPLLISPG